MYPFVVYRQDAPQHDRVPVALSNAATAEDAIDQVTPRWPKKSALVLHRGASADGLFTAQSAYEAPVDDVLRVCALASTELVAVGVNNITTLAVTVQNLVTMAQAAAKLGGKH